ncbi:MAG: protein translocase subunit SecF [Deltaproteobacteria bacterium]|nr:protein translocase subunit SecF [Deltaproteobacteria bacterium]
MKFVTLFDPKSEWNFVGFIPTAVKIGFIIPIATLIGLAVFGVNWGLDFKGGTEIQVKFAQKVEAKAVKELLVGAGFAKNKVQQIGDVEDNELLLRIERITSLTDESAAKIKKTITDDFASLKKGSTFGVETVNVEFEASEGDRITISLPEPVVAGPPKKNKNPRQISGELTALLVNEGGNLPLDGAVLNTLSGKGFDRGAIVAAAKGLGLLVTAPAASQIEPSFSTATALGMKLNAQKAELALLLDQKSGVKLRRSKKKGEEKADINDAISNSQPYKGMIKYTVFFQGISVDVSLALAKAYAGPDWEKCSSAERPTTCPDLRRVDFVDAQVAEGLQTDGLVSVLMALVLILVYVAVRFDLFFSPGAVVALVHDAIGAMALFAFFGLEFDQPSIAALLTVVGYSINNTIVIYDRIRETMPIDTLAPLTMDEVKSYVNKAINDTFSRTVNTSLTTFMAAAALFIFAGGVVQNFAAVLMAGIFLGAFSSTCLAPASYLFFRRTFQNEDSVKETMGPTRDEKFAGVV